MIYRLDDPAWFDRHDLADYAAACLRADFDPDLASGYRTNPGACRQVAAAIADAAGSNFLVASAARTRADETVIDIKVPGWRDWQRFPAEVGQAFDDYLARFGDNETRARDLLRAVAYAEGAGLPADAQWAEVASALAAPRRYGTDDLAWLLDSAASYLVESGGEHGQPTYRIFHQALIEHLRPPGKEQQAQRQIASTLIAAVPRTADGPDWAHAPSYIRRHLAAHTATACSAPTGCLRIPASWSRPIRPAPAGAGLGDQPAGPPGRLVLPHRRGRSAHRQPPPNGPRTCNWPPGKPGTGRWPTRSAQPLHRGIGPHASWHGGHRDATPTSGAPAPLTVRRLP